MVVRFQSAQQWGYLKGTQGEGTGRQKRHYSPGALGESCQEFTLSCDFADCCPGRALTGGAGVSSRAK